MCFYNYDVRILGGGVMVLCIKWNVMMADISAPSDSQREELLAAGILGILAPAVEQVDQKVGEVR